MDNAAQVMTALKKAGSERTRNTYARHGAPADMYGTSVADMKTIAKKIKGRQDLALELYASGNADAQYLAGIVADGAQMTKAQLNKWAKTGTWYMVSEYSVPGVTAHNKHCRDVALKWIDSKTERVAAAGWTSYAAMLSVSDDADLDMAEIRSLLKRVETDIGTAKNRVRYTMNGFVINVGCYVKPLLKAARATAKKIGKVDVNMGDTACKVPLATDYIAKVEKMGRVGKKRKTAKC